MLLVGAILAAAGVASPWANPSASAALTNMPPGFLDEQVVGGLPFPTAVSFAPNGDLFIALKSGIVRVVNDGELLDEPFIDLSGIVHDNDDRGLLGLAVHPEFPVEPYVYLAYTYDPPGTAQDQGWPVAGRVARVERITADADTGYHTALPDSGVVIIGTNSTRENIGNENDGRDTSTVSCMTGGTMDGEPIRDCLGSDENSHTVGTIAFAPDGALLVTNGDGANYNSPDPRALLAQNIDSLAGKVLRVDPLTGDGLADNPFFEEDDAASNRSKVWSYGLRNPFRMTVDPSTGAIWVGDVGWGTWEEINRGKGANFGWPCYEGGAVSGSESANTTSLVQSAYATNVDTADTCAALYAEGLSAVTPPRFAYDHSGGGASANAGAFYSGSVYPEQYQGALFIADYDRRWIRALTFDEAGDVDDVLEFGVDTSGSSGPVQVIAGPDSNLYWVQYSSSGGEVRRIRYVGEGNVPPTAIATATPIAGVAPLSVAFSAANSYDVDGTPLLYHWDFGDGSPSSSETNPVHLFGESGVYEVVLTATEDIPFGQSSETTVMITVGTDPPMASVAPLAQAYSIGDVIEFSGGGTALDDPIPAENHSWQLRHGHNDHVHYSTPVWWADPDEPGVTRGTFEVDEHGDETWYEICLTVTAPSGLTDTSCEETYPDRIEYTILTTPIGMSVSYEDEGLQLDGPALIRPIAGSNQTLSVAAVQNHRTFVGWSDGVTDRSRSFVAGEGPTTFTAVFENLPPTASIASHSGTSGQAPLTVYATAEGADPEGDELSYVWTVDGEIVGEGESPVLEFDTPGELTVVLTATDALGESATDEMSVTVLPAGAIDEPWESRTIGPVYDAGSATLQDGEATVTVGGGDIWGTQDEFRYVYRSVPDDFTATVRVDDLTAADSWARAGLMLRSDMTADASNLSIMLTDGEGVLAAQRAEPGGDSFAVERIDEELSWLRIARSDGEVVLSASDDGETWVVLGTLDWPATQDDRIGLAVSAHGSYPPATATFSNVEVTLPPSSEFADVTYVSDLPLLDVTNGYGPIELDTVNGEDAAGDGGPIVIGGTTFERGLGVHAPSSASVTLNAQCDQFGAVIGVDDTVGANGTVVFTVLGDGVELYESPVLTGGEGGLPILVDVSTVTTLTLEVGDAEDDPYWDHAVWADARLGCNDNLLEEPEESEEPELPFELDGSIPTGDRTHSVTTADLDGDGILDVVAAVPGLDAIAVAIADAPGVFPTVTHLPTGAGTFPKYATAVDVDGDGILDIVSANQDSTTGIDVSVFIGHGDGSFDVGVAYEACERPHEVEVTDLDGDGFVDIAVACWGGDDIGILRGEGDGTFSAAQLYPAGNAGHSLVSADFDGDGMPDLAVAAYGSNRVMLLLNEGDGSFAAPVEYWSGLGPHNIQLTDFDDDGVFDLLVTAENADAVGLLRGRGDGTFHETVFLDVGPNPKAAAVADLNGDGFADIVTVNTHGNYPDGSEPTTMSILYGTEAMTFDDPISIPAPLTPFAVAVVDLYGDGSIAILAANWHSGDVTVFRP